MTAKRHDHRLLILGAVCALVAGGCAAMPVAAAPTAIALWMGSAVWLLVPQTRRRAFIAAIALVAAIPASLVALDHPGREQARAAVASAHLVVEAEAVVITKVNRNDGRLWFDASASAVRVGTADFPGMPIRVVAGVDAVAGTMPDLGARVVLHGTARAEPDGSRAALVLFADTIETTLPPPGILGWASELRRGFVSRVVAGLPEPGAGLLPGLAVGETSGLDAPLAADMTTTSLTHLVAVSGANLAIVSALAFAAAAACGAGRLLRVAIALTALAVFVVIVTPEPSVIRAGAMAVVVLLGIASGRRGAGIAALGAATAALCATDPWLALSYGFVLSAAATAALLLLAAPLAEGLGRVMPRGLALMIAIPLSAQLVCGPIIILLSPVASPYSVLANLLAEPAAPVATVLGMLACIAQPVPVLASGLATLAWLPSAWIAQTATTIAALPAAEMAWWPGLLGAILLALVSAATAIVIIPGGVPLVRRLAALVGTGVLAVAVGVAALGGALAPLTHPGSWSIAQCDIGQGDAVVLRAGGTTILVDAGPDPERLDACLTTLGVDRIDVFIATHYDLDHIGGVSALTGRVVMLLHGPGSAEELAELQAVRPERFVEARIGMRSVGGGIDWQVLWPPIPSLAFPTGNDASVVIRAEAPGLPSILLLGDLGEHSQHALLVRGGELRAQVVKVAHHGSADQDPSLYDAIRAPLALIGVGADNTYGHPTRSTLDFLSADHAAIARSDRDGLVLVGEDASGDLWWWREHPDTGE